MSEDNGVPGLLDITDLSKPDLPLEGTPDHPAKAPDIIIPGVNDHNPLVTDYSDAKNERHPAGIVWVNGREVAQTLQCPHCGGHFVSRRGSGHRRTFCMKCMAVTCGRLACDPCHPWAENLQINQGREF